MTLSRMEREEISRSVARIQTEVLAVVCAMLGGIGLFLLTAVLLIKGGQNVGSHLQLLSNYFPGYAVSWPGSLLGLLYGALAGGVAGWLVGAIYNKVVAFRGF
ncbi:hypothetical protein YTPLAS18_19370 [Nitrospira sp.]|nr:hypothetical protein YTPLAS18_19370 [Nitrospira sp.]